MTKPPSTGTPLQPQHAVGADAGPPVAQRPHRLRVERRGVRQHDEVVLGAVALHEPHRTRVSAAATRSGSAASSQRTRGSRRNQDRCRRTNRRVAVTVCSRASVGVAEREHLLVAQRPAGRRPVPQPDPLQRAHLGDQAAGPHPVHPGRDPVVEVGPVESDVDGVVPLDRLRQRRRERPAGQLDHLERPYQPAAVRRQDSPGRIGVHLGQSRVERRRAVRGQLGLQPGPQGRVGAGEVELVDDGADVQAGPADEQRHPAAGEHVVDRGPGQPLVLGDAGPLGHVPHVEHVVRYATPLGRRRLRGADVHAPVELHGVGVDDLGAETPGQLDGERGLAGRGGTDERDQPAHRAAQNATK